MNQCGLRWFLLRKVNREGTFKVFLRLLAMKEGEFWPGDLDSMGVMRAKNASGIALAGGPYLPRMEHVFAEGFWELGTVWVWSILGIHILGKRDSAALKNHCILKPTAAPKTSLNQTR